MSGALATFDSFPQAFRFIMEGHAQEVDMAFDFGSDILVDAMKAADPQQAAEARLKLQKLSAAS